MYHAPVADPFRLYLRVRYSECDAQGIVFNARWGEYVDVAASEYSRSLFGSVDSSSGIDWRLVKQVLEWKRPGRFDDVLEARVETLRVGTTSFTLRTEFRRSGSDEVLVSAETVYVVVDPVTGDKRPVAERHRAALLAGAPGIVVDQAAAAPRAAG